MFAVGFVVGSVVEGVEHLAKQFFRLFVGTALQKLTGIAEAVGGGGFVLAYGVAVSSQGLLCGVYALVAVGDFHGYLSAAGLVLGRSL